MQLALPCKDFNPIIYILPGQPIRFERSNLYIASQRSGLAGRVWFSGDEPLTSLPPSWYERTEVSGPLGLIVGTDTWVLFHRDYGRWSLFDGELRTQGRGYAILSLSRTPGLRWKSVPADIGGKLALSDDLEELGECGFAEGLRIFCSQLFVEP